MLKITYADVSQAPDIADFQCKMALQTQNLKLNKQLVNEAVAYIIKHQEYGKYFVPVVEDAPHKACGSLLITYENKKSWWIQSVYVVEEYRRKGFFTSMFKAVVEKGRQSGAQSIQLYVEKQNKRAKETYHKLGMHCNGNQFYGLELVYGSQQAKKELTCELAGNIEVVEVQCTSAPKEHELVRISGKYSEYNRMLQVLQQKNVIGICQFFYEFSDWRFGIIVYINHFEAKQKHEKQALQSAIQHLFKNSPLKIGAIRIICTSQEMKALHEIMPNMHRDVYDVMQIDL